MVFSMSSVENGNIWWFDVFSVASRAGILDNCGGV